MEQKNTILVQTYEFLKMMIGVMKHFPRDQKFLIADRMQGQISDLLELFIVAPVRYRLSKVLGQPEPCIVVPVVRVVPVTISHSAIIFVVVPRTATQHTTGFSTASVFANLPFPKRFSNKNKGIIEMITFTLFKKKIDRLWRYSLKRVKN